MTTGELPDVNVNAQVPLIAAELGYWQPGIKLTNASIRKKGNSRLFLELDGAVALPRDPECRCGVVAGPMSCCFNIEYIFGSVSRAPTFSSICHPSDSAQR